MKSSMPMRSADGAGAADAAAAGGVDIAGDVGAGCGCASGVRLSVNAVSLRGQSGPSCNSTRSPLVFLSSASVAVASMPGFLQGFGKLQPLSLMVHSGRALTLGSQAQAELGHAPSYYVVRAVIWAVAIFAISAPLAVARYRRG